MRPLRATHSQRSSLICCSFCASSVLKIPCLCAQVYISTKRAKSSLMNSSTGGADHPTATHGVVALGSSVVWGLWGCNCYMVFKLTLRLHRRILILILALIDFVCTATSIFASELLEVVQRDLQVATPSFHQGAEEVVVAHA